MPSQESQAQPEANTSNGQVKVTEGQSAWLEEETTSAKIRALNKQWPVDLPTREGERIQALLECIPGEPRFWTVCIEAVQAYVAAGEPVRRVNFWNRGVHALHGKPLWQVIGQALATRDTPAHAAIEELDRLRGRQA